MNDDTIGNQQEILDTDIAWLAGIIDGEGSICMNVRQKHWNGWNGIGVDLHIGIVNTDGGIIHKFVSVLRKLGIEAHLHESEQNPIYNANGRKYQNHSKTIVQAGISKMRDILNVLTRIQPYLAGEKSKRALLIMQFIERRIERQTKRSKGGATWYDGYDWDIVKKFYDITGGRLLPEVKKILNDYTQLQNQQTA